MYIVQPGLHEHSAVTCKALTYTSATYFVCNCTVFNHLAIFCCQHHPPKSLFFSFANVSYSYWLHCLPGICWFRKLTASSTASVSLEKQKICDFINCVINVVGYLRILACHFVEYNLWFLYLLFSWHWPSRKRRYWIKSMTKECSA